MNLTAHLVSGLKQELKATRTSLERIPEGHTDFKCHAKSMALDKLAGHVAQLCSFGSSILSAPGFDFGAAKPEQLVFRDHDQILNAFDTLSTQVEADLAATTEAAFDETWCLTFNNYPIFSGTRFTAYRTTFLNHLIHHRAQLGVYLRLLNAPVPATYGPSADD